MLSGKVQRHQERIAKLNIELESFTQKVAALDLSIALADSRVNPSAIEGVNAHTEKYGGRGGLTNFLESEVSAAGSTGISMVDLTRRAANHFEIQGYTSNFLASYRYTVRTRLRALQEMGRIESETLVRDGRRSSIWRKREGHSSFGELLKQSDAIKGNRGG